MIIPWKVDFALFIDEIPGICPCQCTTRLDSMACVYLCHTDRLFFGAQHVGLRVRQQKTAPVKDIGEKRLELESPDREGPFCHPLSFSTTVTLHCCCMYFDIFF